MARWSVSVSGGQCQCQVVRWSSRWSGGKEGWLVVWPTSGQVICTITLYTILCRSPMRLTPGASRTHVGATIIRY